MTPVFLIIYFALPIQCGQEEFKDLTRLRSGKQRSSYDLGPVFELSLDGDLAEQLKNLQPYTKNKPTPIGYSDWNRHNKHDHYQHRDLVPSDILDSEEWHKNGYYTSSEITDSVSDQRYNKKKNKHQKYQEKDRKASEEEWIIERGQDDDSDSSGDDDDYDNYYDNKADEQAPPKKPTKHIKGARPKNLWGHKTKTLKIELSGFGRENKNKDPMRQSKKLSGEEKDIIQEVEEKIVTLKKLSGTYVDKLTEAIEVVNEDMPATKLNLKKKRLNGGKKKPSKLNGGHKKKASKLNGEDSGVNSEDLLKKLSGEYAKLSGEVMKKLGEEHAKLSGKFLQKLNGGDPELFEETLLRKFSDEHAKLSGKAAKKLSKKYKKLSGDVKKKLSGKSKKLSGSGDTDEEIVEKLTTELADLKILNGVLQQKLSGEEVDQSAIDIGDIPHDEGELIVQLSEEVDEVVELKAQYITKLTEAVEEAQETGDSEIVQLLSDEMEDLEAITDSLEAKLNGKLEDHNDHVTSLSSNRKQKSFGGLSGGGGGKPSKTRVCLLNSLNEYCVGEETKAR